jgi:hypothetical protein
MCKDWEEKCPVFLRILTELLAIWQMISVFYVYSGNPKIGGEIKPTP